MDIKEAIKERHSVRQYKADPIPQELRDRLNAVIEECNKESGLNIQLVCDDKECFDTLVAHYGRFSNAYNYIAMIGRKDMKDLSERCGYFGQRIVLEAQMMGLNTCWVAGSYGKGKVKASKTGDEKIVCVISVGFGATSGKVRRSKPLDKLTDVAEADRPDWFREGLEAASLAPTAVNQQRFLISLKGGEAVAKAPIGFLTKVDLGIVRYNFEAGSGHKCG